MTDQRRREEAFDDPAQYFATPQAVVDATEFSREDKRAILERWRLDALRLSDSEQEGMGGGESAELAEIERRLYELKPG